MTSPFQPLAPDDQAMAKLTLCTQTIIALELLTSDNSQVDNLTNLFNNAASEYTYGEKISLVTQSTADTALENVTSIVNGMKAAWLAESITAEVATTASSVGQLCAAIFSWAPGVNLCIDLVAIGAYAVSQGLEIAADTEQSHVVGYIGNFNNKVLSQPGLEDVMGWNNAVQSNVLLFKKLNLAASDLDIQATLMAITHRLLETNQDLTPANYGQVLFQIGSAKKNFDDIDTAWNTAINAIIKNPVLSETQSQKIDLDAKFPEAAQATDIVMNIYTSLLCINDARYISALKKAGVRDVFAKGVSGKSAAAESEGDIATKNNLSGLETWSNRLKAFGGLINVAVIVTGIIAFIDTLSASSKLDQAINDAHDGMKDFFSSIISASGAEKNVENAAVQNS
ncbi:hypothetical protein [Azospirillum sp. B506]|uniref:hypothetical protein n=1 Tax=Azospirillum sp. B506 TaxID=137721 RepID=UPI000348FF59|nr:hypothetical protein [Azospirillum sp. B506]